MKTGVKKGTKAAILVVIALLPILFGIYLSYPKRTPLPYIGKAVAKGEGGIISKTNSQINEEVGAEPLRIELLLPKDSSRLDTFLKMPAIATNGAEPPEMHELFLRAIKFLEDGFTEENKETILQSLGELESALLGCKDPAARVPLLLFIGAVYRHLQEWQEAIDRFDEVPQLYPDSPLASLAVAAMGRVYEKDLREWDKAEERYFWVLDHYPHSYEAQPAGEGLDRIRILRHHEAKNE